MIPHAGAAIRSRRLPDCPICRGPVEAGAIEAVLSTNRGYRFPMLLVQTCPACDQAVSVELDEKEMARRRQGWTRPEPRVARGVLAKYARTVHSASEGAVTG